MVSKSSSAIARRTDERTIRRAPRFDRELFILGSGMFSYKQMTIETVEILKSCSTVYHLSTSEVDQYLRGICPLVVSLSEMYGQQGRDRMHVYKELVDTVLSGARRVRRSAYVVLGHPALYDHSVHTLRARASDVGLKVDIKPAVSAFDSILLELDVDVGKTGVQIYEANRLKKFEHPLDASVPVLLFQLGGFGSGLNTFGLRSKPSRLVPLQDYLLRFYPPEHQVLVLECQISEGHRVASGWIPLADLPRAAPHLNYNTSLYIPAARKPKVKDPSFVRRAKSVKYMRSITEVPERESAASKSA